MEPTRSADTLLPFSDFFSMDLPVAGPTAVDVAAEDMF